jgi:hypothetical protein
VSIATIDRQEGLAHGEALLLRSLAARAKAPQADTLDLAVVLGCSARVSQRRPRTRLNLAWVALLSLILVWNGMGRGLMLAAEAAPAAVVVAGVEISLCAQRTDDGRDKGIAQHDCEICTLRVPGALPSPPPSAVPHRIATPAHLGGSVGAIRLSPVGPGWHLPRGPPSHLA